MIRSSTVKPQRWLLAIATLVFFTFCAPSRSQTFNENALVANYLAGFAEFTKWESPTETPITIGVLNSPGVLKELRQLSNREDSTGIRIQGTEWSANQTLEGIDILFIAPGHRELWADIIEQAKRYSTLTVASEPGFHEAEGLIRFIHRRNRLRFAINQDAAAHYQIHFSSKLIQVAIPDEP